MTIGKLLLALTLTLPTCGAFAQFPNKQIKIVVPAPPAGSTDILARLIQPVMQDALKQTVVVENRGGAGGYIGTEYVAKSPADGYTQLLGGAFSTITASLQKQPSYRPGTDLTAVAIMVTVPNILVAGPKLKVNSVAELIAAAKASPGAINVGSNGIGTTLHLSAELFKLQTGTDFTHVSYKGWADCMRALVSGEIEMMFDNLSAALPNINEKKLRAFAVAAHARHRSLPDVPTLSELGVKNAEVSSWFGILVPAGTPVEVKEIIGRPLKALSEQAEFRRNIEQQGMDVEFIGPAEAGKFWLSEVDKWDKVVKAAKLAQ